MRDVLPESVIYRKKSWADAVISPEWLNAGDRWMHRVVPESWSVLGLSDQQSADVLKSWDRRSPQRTVTALAFWHKLFVEFQPNRNPPTWEELVK